MPRPPRTKVASRVAKPTKSKSAPRRLPAKTAATQTRKPADGINSFSEDSDGLVTKTRTTRSKRMLVEKPAEVNDEEELMMTGALPVGDAVKYLPGNIRTPASDATARTQTTRGSGRPSITKRSPAVLTSAPPRSSDADLGARSPPVEESSGFDLTLSSLGSGSPAHGTRPPSAIKVGATPAHERSILALTNFKRRARQPSLLRMVQQTTDLEDNDHDDLDNTDNFDFDDFLPHAESTPLNVRRSAVDDETRNDSGTQISSSGSRGTKRKLSPVVQVPRSSPPFSPPSGGDVDSARSPSPSLPEVLPSREDVIEQTQEEQELLSETYAPPKSSSPIREATETLPSPGQQRLRRGRRPAKSPIQDTDSEAEETETPARSRRRTNKKDQSTISTAQLKGLLPRRRNRMRDRDEFDLDSSEDVTQLESDQDELQMPMRRTRQRPRADKLASPKAAKKPTRGKKTVPAKVTQKASRTYSRRISSDKENDVAQEQDEGPTEVSLVEHSEKLAAIRKKFEEVDAFELEFETVDVTTSSSPFR